MELTGVHATYSPFGRIGPSPGRQDGRPEIQGPPENVHDPVEQSVELQEKAVGRNLSPADYSLANLDMAMALTDSTVKKVLSAGKWCFSQDCQDPANARMIPSRYV